MPTLECVNDITNQNNLCLLNLKLDRTEWLITNDLELETAKYKHRHDLVDKGTCWQIYYSSDYQLWYASLRPINLYKAQNIRIPFLLSET